MEFKGGSWKVMQNYVHGTKSRRQPYVVGIIRQGEQVKKLKKKTGESGKTA